MINKVEWNGKEIELVSRGTHELYSNSNGVFYVQGINEDGEAVELVFECIDECVDEMGGYGTYVDGNTVYVDIDDLLSDGYDLVDVYRK